PHKRSDGTDYSQVCRRCHAADFNARVTSGRHTASADCIGCHMPKRRTDDVVHVVMTDHYIQRRKPDRNLLAPLAEQHESEVTRYRGEVVLYSPPKLRSTPEAELYLAVAQVVDATNLETGVARLKQAIEASHPKQAGFYFHLAEGLSKSGKTNEV